MKLTLRLVLSGLLGLSLVPSSPARPAWLPGTSKLKLLSGIIEGCYTGIWGGFGNKLCKTADLNRFPADSGPAERQPSLRDRWDPTTPSSIIPSTQSGAARPRVSDALAMSATLVPSGVCIS